MTQDFLRKPTAVILIVLSIIGRLIPHPANVTPLGGTALFGGAKLERPWNYIAPLFVLYVTDLLIGFHGTIGYVYGAFLLTVFLGERFLSKNPHLLKVGLAGVGGALIFFLVSNFGVWIEGMLYPRTFHGLIECYTMALPFLRNSLLGDVLFSVGFFAVYQWAERADYVHAFDKRVIHWLGK